MCPDTLGLVLEGEGSKLLVIGDTVLIGRIPANRNGGLIAMGHPLGLTGLGQIAEILWQMHCVASLLQIPQEVHVALAHMIGAGGVYVIHMLRR